MVRNIKEKENEKRERESGKDEENRKREDKSYSEESGREKVETVARDGGELRKVIQKKNKGRCK